MKKFTLKLMAIACIFALCLSFGGCKETIDGSVVKRADLVISYTVGEETQNIESTLILYETFAPKTTERVISLIEDGYYDDTVITIAKNQDYLIIGGYTFGEDYTAKNYSGSGVKGEFTQNGLRSELTVKAGALVMLRDFDEDDGSSKYDSAKASFAIVLTDSGTFNSSEFCVFGYIDSESLTALQEALVDNSKDDNAYLRARYLGERENGVQTYENGFEYYLNESGVYFKDVAGEKIQMDYDVETDVDYATAEIIKDSANAQDIVILPSTVFKVSATMHGGCSK